MYEEMKGKVAIVTGGTRGLGYGISKAFLEHGVSVIAFYVSNDGLLRYFQDGNYFQSFP